MNRHLLVFGLCVLMMPLASEAKLEIATADGKYKARLAGRVQARLSLTDAGDGAPTTAAFSIPRARVKISGTAFADGLSYAFQADFGKGKAGLKDFYVQYFANSHFGVRIGQAKKPFSRQQLTSSGKQAFVDRASTDKAFGGGRDIGVTLLSDYKRTQMEWAVGVYNGTGEGVVPDQMRPTVVARVGYRSEDMKGYSEADLEGGGFRWAVAANTQIHFDMESGAARDESAQAGADFIVKAHGFSATGGAYASWEGSNLGDADYTGLGGHVQAGYVIGGVYQPALRFSMLAPDGGESVMDLSGAFSVFLFGSHSLKWQTDVTATVPETGDTIIAARTQLQLAY